MVITVHIPYWHLEEDGDVIAVGDSLSTWLEFHEASRWEQPPDRQDRLTGTAHPIPTWPGAERDRYPTIITARGARIYWDAPKPYDGAVDVVGVVSANNVDAPNGFPLTNGIATRVRMQWQDYRLGQNHAWHPISGTARYEDVTSSYLPHPDLPDPAQHAEATPLTWTGVLVDLDVVDPT